MKIEITMIDNVIVTYEGDNVTLDEFVDKMGLANNKRGFVKLQSNNGTIAINPNNVITLREIK